MKIVIVDDEKPARDRMRQMIDELDNHEVVGEAANGSEALDVVARRSPDVVLLDIRMPDMDGIETAHHLNALDAPPAIVFATAYDQYAIDAFDAQAIGYILKPVRRQRLTKALAQAARLSRESLNAAAEDSGMAERRRQVCVQVHGELKLIPVARIAFFQADQKYTRLADGEREYLVDDTLKQLEEEFGDDFVRIHRNALVAVSFIDALEKSPDGEVSVRLRGNITPQNEALRVSRRHVAAVRRRLKGQKP